MKKTLNIVQHFVQQMMQWSWIVLGILLLLNALGATPVLAHHAMGGKLPTNFLEGFFSGLAHPIIGLDHFAFVVAIGLLAAVSRFGISMPIAFALTALLGTGIHLRSLDLPQPELFISASVFIFGAILALKQRPPIGVGLSLAAIAGLFHGYAYGESIVGAQSTVLYAYLVGFTVIQLGISLVVCWLTQRFLSPATEQSTLKLQFAGFVLSGIGFAFLSTVLTGLIFQLP